MLRKCISCLVLVFVFSSQAFAEKIIMNDGTVIEAPILERGSYYIKIQTGAMPKRIFRDQIKEILSDDEKVPFTIDTTKFLQVSEEKIVLIQQLIEVNGALDSMESNLAVMFDKMQNSKQKEQFKDLLD